MNIDQLTAQLFAEIAGYQPPPILIAALWLIFGWFLFVAIVAALRTARMLANDRINGRDAVSIYDPSSGDSMHNLSRESASRYVAAVVTLKSLGYTYHGGAAWKPPLGPAPDLSAEGVMKEREPVGGLDHGWPGEYNRGWNQHIAAIRAQGLAVVPVEPSDELLTSMAMRYDHGFGMPGFYDTPPFGRPGEHARRLESVKRQMRQLHEEVVGTGFYCEERKDYYRRIANPERCKDGGIKCAACAPGECHWKEPKAESQWATEWPGTFVDPGKVCQHCLPIVGPELASRCATQHNMIDAFNGDAPMPAPGGEPHDWILSERNNEKGHLFVCKNCGIRARLSAGEAPDPAKVDNIRLALGHSMVCSRRAG